MDDDSAAMKAVIDGMGRAAREAKVKKYTPKPVEPPPEAVAAPDASAEVSAADLEALLNGG